MAATPPRVPERRRQNFWAAEKFTKRHRSDKSQQTDPASPHHSLYLNLSHPAGRRGSSGEYDMARLQVTDMSHHLKPCGTIIPLSLWREEGEGGGRRCERRSGGVVGAGGCFTPGLFKETAQGMPLALLTKHFSLPPSLSLFFFAFLFFFLSIAGCAPVKSSGPQSSPTAIWGCLRNFLADIWACFGADVSNE